MLFGCICETLVRNFSSLKFLMLLGWWNQSRHFNLDMWSTVIYSKDEWNLSILRCHSKYKKYLYNTFSTRQKLDIPLLFHTKYKFSHWILIMFQMSDCYENFRIWSKEKHHWISKFYDEKNSLSGFSKWKRKFWKIMSPGSNFFFAPILPLKVNEKFVQKWDGKRKDKKTRAKVIKHLWCIQKDVKHVCPRIFYWIYFENLFFQNH